MGCSCGKTPLQKLENRLKSWGWAQLTPSYLQIADEYIQSKLGKLPKDMDERIDLFNQAKNI